MLRHNRTFVRMTFILVVMVLVTALSSASLMASTPEAQLQAEANKAVVETYFGQVLSKGDVAAADAILAPSFARIDRRIDYKVWLNPMPRARWEGKSALYLSLMAEMVEATEEGLSRIPEIIKHL